MQLELTDWVQLGAKSFRKAVVNLGKPNREADADTHLLIVAGRDRADPEYSMVLCYDVG